MKGLIEAFKDIKIKENQPDAQQQQQRNRCNNLF